MKRITVTRKKKLASAMMPYWIIAGPTKEAFMEAHGFKGDLCEMADSGFAVSRISVEELDRIGIRISNGQSAELELPDDVRTLFVSTMDGCLSNEVIVEGEEFVISTTGGFRKLPCPVIEAR